MATIGKNKIISQPQWNIKSQVADNKYLIGDIFKKHYKNMTVVPSLQPHERGITHNKEEQIPTSK